MKREVINLIKIMKYSEWKMTKEYINMKFLGKQYESKNSQHSS